MTKKKNILVIIQARTDSQRLPKKILKKIEGKPLLWHVIQRIRYLKNVDIAVATTTRKIDDKIVQIAQNCEVGVYRGKVNDVLDRFYKTALKFKADIVIRITADCPLIDPHESSKVLRKFLKGNFDYVSSDDKTYPKGFDTECFSFKVLEKAWKNAKLLSEREHVTPYIWKNSTIFKLSYVKNKNKPVHKLRLVVDHKDDLILIRTIYSKLYKKNKIFLMNEIFELFQKQPNLIKINSGHNPEEGYQYSLAKD